VGKAHRGGIVRRIVKMVENCMIDEKDLLQAGQIENDASAIVDFVR